MTSSSSPRFAASMSRLKSSTRHLTQELQGHCRITADNLVKTALVTNGSQRGKQDCKRGDIATVIRSRETMNGCGLWSLLVGMYAKDSLCSSDEPGWLYRRSERRIRLDWQRFGSRFRGVLDAI